MNIKVCGITTLKQLQQLDGLNIDFAGLIFEPGSPRYVGDSTEKNQIAEADFDLRRVGVFVNPGLGDAIDAIDEFKLDAVQLHGDESPELCDDLSSQAEVIKVFSIDESVKDIDALIAPYDAVCDYYLFDTKAEGKAGGTGKKFNWDLIAKAKIEKPFFLSGGIGTADAAAIKAFKHPDFFGIDINSLFEKEPGVKDMALLLQFLQSLK
ncbi:MAG TPA: phosphoribosylanthranilate isomerase [Ferruginibacter sp.]|nr:phosphoribosylanthranilate isomerase [Ferruginibacter sp.]